MRRRLEIRAKRASARPASGEMEGDLRRRGVSADPPGVKCSHSEEHSCYRHPCYFT